ncbi:hypothetical protein SUGI_0922470 [Cryptomeria japonica]|nr:hypothetical protein SUGI_0922470 [Cryptomeria japonica]
MKLGNNFEIDASSPNGMGYIGAGETLPCGEGIKVMSLPNDYFLIEFPDGNDMWNTLQSGPYMLHGIGVHLIDWQLNFNPKTHKLPECPVWVRLYNIPSETGISRP